MNSYNVITLRDHEIDFYNINLKLFEKLHLDLYPYGNDYFTIDHGNDYNAFFKRLGNCVYRFIIVCKNTNTVIGLACAVLREYNNKLFWYLCDLKIDKLCRGRNLSYSLFLQMFPLMTNITTSGYAISMDPTSEIIAKIFNKLTIGNFNILSVITGPKLFIYNIDKNTFLKNSYIFTQIFGSYKFYSLNGVKDLTLKSTNKIIDIYHLQHGIYTDENSVTIENIPDTALCMFCLTNANKYNDELNNIGIFSNASATIFHRNMQFFDWENILTSDI